MCGQWTTSLSCYGMWAVHSRRHHSSLLHSADTFCLLHFFVRFFQVLIKLHYYSVKSCEIIFLNCSVAQPVLLFSYKSQIDDSGEEESVSLPHQHSFSSLKADSDYIYQVNRLVLLLAEHSLLLTVHFFLRRTASMTVLS